MPPPPLPHTTTTILVWSGVDHYNIVINKLKPFLLRVSGVKNFLLQKQFYTWLTYIYIKLKIVISVCLFVCLCPISCLQLMFLGKAGLLSKFNLMTKLIVYFLDTRDVFAEMCCWCFSSFIRTLSLRKNKSHVYFMFIFCVYKDTKFTSNNNKKEIYLW